MKPRLRYREGRWYCGLLDSSGNLRFAYVDAKPQDALRICLMFLGDAHG